MIAAAGLLPAGLLVIPGIAPFDRGTRDTARWDMFMALAGASTSQLLSRRHDRQLRPFPNHHDHGTSGVAAA